MAWASRMFEGPVEGGSLDGKVLVYPEPHFRCFRTCEEEIEVYDFDKDKGIWELAYD